jgi:uncharacterized membrane protein
METTDRSSTGLEPNVAGMLCYVLLVITGVGFLIFERQSSTVRFHALQSIFFWLAVMVIGGIASVVPVIGTLVQILLVPVAFFVWIALMVKAFQGERWKLPLIGNWAEANAPLR